MIEVRKNRAVAITDDREVAFVDLVLWKNHRDESERWLIEQVVDYWCGGFKRGEPA